MTARSSQQPEAEWFTAPVQVNHRRYEALRAYFTQGLSYAEAGARFGYTRWAMIDLVRGGGPGSWSCSPRRGGPARHRAPRRPKTGPAGG